jgi:hypothetical protein
MTLCEIAKDVGFMFHDSKTHVLVLDLVLQSLCCRVDIVLLINGVCTLVNVVIIDPTRVDLV